MLFLLFRSCQDTYKKRVQVLFSVIIFSSSNWNTQTKIYRIVPKHAWSYTIITIIYYIIIIYFIFVVAEFHLVPCFSSSLSHSYSFFVIVTSAPLTFTFFFLLFLNTAYSYYIVTEILSKCKYEIEKEKENKKERRLN